MAAKAKALQEQKEQLWAEPATSEEEVRQAKASVFKYTTLRVCCACRRCVLSGQEESFAFVHLIERPCPMSYFCVFCCVTAVAAQFSGGGRWLGATRSWWWRPWAWWRTRTRWRWPWWWGQGRPSELECDLCQPAERGQGHRKGWLDNQGDSTSHYTQRNSAAQALHCAALWRAALHIADDMPCMLRVLNVRCDAMSMWRGVVWYGAAWWYWSVGNHGKIRSQGGHKPRCKGWHGTNYGHRHSGHGQIR